MIRDPLMWLGCADPCATMEKIREQDSRLATKNAIAALWLAIFETKEKTAAQVIDEATRRTHDDLLIHREFHTVLAEIARDGKGLSALRLGDWLRQVKGTVITLDTSRYTFESSLSRTKVTLWRLAEIPKQLDP
jgi:putative DNA primase/helicase